MGQIERFNFKSLGGSDAFTPMPASDITVAAVPEEVKPPPEPTFSAAEIEQAKREAYANGFRDAQKEAETRAQSELNQQNQAIANLETSILAQLKTAAQAQAQLFESKRQEVTQISMAIAKKVAGAALKTEPLAAIEELVSQCLKSLVGESKLTVTVNPSVHLALQKRLQPILESSGFEGETLITTDESLKKEDCKVEWKHGSAVRDSNQIWSQIEALINASKIKQAAAKGDEPDADETNTIYLANR